MKNVLLSLAVAFGAGQALACFDMPVKLKLGKDAEGRFANALVSTTARAVTVDAEDGTRFTFRWVGNMEKGSWCYYINKGKGLEGCMTGKVDQKLKKAGLQLDDKPNELLIKDAKGRTQGVIRSYDRIYTDTGTPIALLELVHALDAVYTGTKIRTVKYFTPMMQFYYNVRFTQNELDTNDLDAVEAAYRKQGVTDTDNQIIHLMEGRLYQTVIDDLDLGHTLGTLKGLEKIESPLKPKPKGGIGGGSKPSHTANLYGEHWEGVSSSGCSSSVRKTGDAKR
ncbi:hypothetical protein K2X33_15125 [bacterium]|nr:hypothetical protein [bacterium]